MRKFKYFLCGRALPFAISILLVSAAYLALSLWLPRALAPIALAERLFSFSAGVFVVCSHTFSESKTAKLLLLVLFPWTGALLCLLQRGRGELPAAALCATEALSLPRKIGEISRSLCGHGGCAFSDAEYFPTGRDAFEKMLADLKNARRSVKLEYYIIARGAFWNSVLAVLEQKAKAGVDVKVIYDDFGCSLTLPRDYHKQLAARGIKTQIYRPLRFPSTAAGARDHRKLAIIDDRIAYTGGINLADEYIGETVRFGHWKDTAVRVTGGLALECSALFCEHWNELGKGGKITPDPSSVPQGNAFGAAFADGAYGARTGAAVHAALIYGAARSLYLCTPYLAPDATLISALKAAAYAGLDVRVMIPHIPDKKAVFALTRFYARRLAAAGVRVREYTSGFLHAKSAVADGEHCVVSSYNFDFRSMYLQAECGVYVQSAALAEAMERDFLSVWETGTELTKAKPSERFTGGLMRLIAPLV